MRKIRGKRMPDRPVVSTQRDIQMFTLIGLTRYVATYQLATEFFQETSIDACRKRLRKLYDAGYVNITLAGSQTSNLVSLTTKGLSVIKQNYPELSSVTKLSGSIRLSGVRHHLACVDTRLYFASLCKKNNFSLIEWSNSKGNLAENLGLHEHHILPDGLSKIQIQGSTIHIAFEIDCGTESLRVLGNKLKKYKQVFEDNLLDELWLVSLSGKARQRAIANQVQKTGLSNHTRLFDINHIKARPVEEPTKTVSKLVRGCKTPNTAKKVMQNA